MKIILIFLLVASLSPNAFASDHSYDASGTDSSGGAVDGTVDSNNGERNVNGKVTDENGNTRSYEE